MAANLEDVPSVELMTELLRRFKCSSKPDKRIILVGKAQPLFPPASPLILLLVVRPPRPSRGKFSTHRIGGIEIRKDGNSSSILHMKIGSNLFPH